MESVLQFGGGKFLRAFVDLFIHKANASGQDVGRVVVVQSSRSWRAKAINDQRGVYRVIIRGLIDDEMPLGKESRDRSPPNSSASYWQDTERVSAAV